MKNRTEVLFDVLKAIPSAMEMLEKLLDGRQIMTLSDEDFKTLILQILKLGEK